jgi:hypothetical protein
VPSRYVTVTKDEEANQEVRVAARRAVRILGSLFAFNETERNSRNENSAKNL